MLSQLQEKGKVGGALTGAQTIISPMWYIEVCHQYWPDQGIESYGEFTIESGGQEVHDGYTTRTLYLAAAKVGVATVDMLAVCMCV